MDWPNAIVLIILTISSVILLTLLIMLKVLKSIANFILSPITSRTTKNRRN